MKKLTVFLLSLVLLFGCLGFASCKDEKSNPKNDPDYGWTPNY